MNAYTIKSYNVECNYSEDKTLNESLKEFADFLFKEGLIDVNTLYDKETGELFRRLSIDVNKKVYSQEQTFEIYKVIDWDLISCKLHEQAGRSSDRSCRH